MQHLIESATHSVSQSIGKIVAYIFEQMVLAYPLTLTMFLRFNFGERYCQPLSLLFGFTYIAVYTVIFGAIFSKLDGQNLGSDVGLTMIMLYAHVFIVVCILRSWRHWSRFFTDSFVRQHSQYEGTSYFSRVFTQTKEWVIRMAIEPLALLSFGMTTGMWISWSFGGYFVFGAFGLLVRELMIHGFWRQMIIRYIDHGIEAADVSYTLKHHVINPAPSPNEPLSSVITECFHNHTSDQTVSLDEMISKLDSKLKNVVRTSPESTTSTSTSKNE